VRNRTVRIVTTEIMPRKFTLENRITSMNTTV